MCVQSDLAKPWLQSWPFEDLESVEQCPVCDSSERALLLSNLVDNVFRASAGEWELFSCQSCESAYLHPRPTQASIHKAYAVYYTHKAAISRKNPEQLNFFRRVRRVLVNGYTNQRYGTNYLPSKKIGSVLANLLPSLRKRLDLQFRWLPKPILGQRLLDVGCGNGAFLIKAQEAGWQVVGVDPDINAVETARNEGLDARVGSIDAFNGHEDLFDAVTLSHVIEHVHEPVDFLVAAHRLLKPGGTLYLDTPNIQSRGFSLFGKNWRGLETPRHLALFNSHSIYDLLIRCGFEKISFKRRTAVTTGMYLSSQRLALGVSPYGNEPSRLSSGFAFRANMPFCPKTRLEFITLTARKRCQ